MEIYLYTFDKKQNSTYFQNRDLGAKFDGELAAAFDVVAPVVLFALPATAAPAYNHAEIPAFGRKYFIDRWLWANGRWEAQLSVDVLASYKREIGNSSLYVLRSSAEFDGNIIDTEYPGKGGKIRRATIAAEHGWLWHVDSGVYVVGIVNKATNTLRVGATSYYAFYAADFKKFMALMLGSVDYLNIEATELSESLQKAIINPMQYIVSCIWFPYSDGFNFGANLGGSVDVGWWTITGDFTARSVAGTFDGFAKDITIPKHPQTAERGQWVNKSPTSVYSLEFQPWGVIPIDADKIYNLDTLHIVNRIDHITGVAILRGFSSDNATIFESAAQVGVPIQIAQMSMDWANLTTASAATAVVAAGATTYANVYGNSKPVPPWERPQGTASENAAQVVKQMLPNIGNALNSILAEVSVSGNNGSASSYSLPVLLNAFFTELAPDDNDHNGRPLCKIRRLDSIPGFILVKDAEIGIGRTLGEQTLIRSYLEGGFFFE